MTVRELRRQLERLPQDADVLISTPDGTLVVHAAGWDEEGEPVWLEVAGEEV